MPIIMAFIRKHPVATYFVVTHAVSWGGVLPVISGPAGVPATSGQYEMLFPFPGAGSRKGDTGATA